MMSSEGILSSLYELGRYNAAVVGIGVVAIILWAFYVVAGQSGGPPHLGESIPFLSNTLELSKDPEAFCARAL
jgi:hypothetical protein